MALSEPAGHPEQTGGTQALPLSEPSSRTGPLEEGSIAAARIDRFLAAADPGHVRPHRVGQSVQPQMATGAVSRIGRSPDDDAQTRDEEGSQEDLDRHRRPRRRCCCWWSPVSSSSRRRATPAVVKPPRESTPTTAKRSPLGSRSPTRALPATGWRPPRPTAPSGFSAAWRRMTASADSTRATTPRSTAGRAARTYPFRCSTRCR